MKPLLSKQTIWNFFEGKTTPLQNTLIQEWLLESANLELYFQWLEDWERENPQFTPNVDQAYMRSLQLAGSAVDTAPETPVRSLGNRIQLYPWAAAACLLLTLGMYLGRDLWLYKRYETGYGEIRTIRLPDNSRVSLNAHSSLTVPRFGFGSGSREVQLSGEAEFAIQHLPGNQRFIVRTPDQLEVQVLGTEFIVYSRERGSKVVLSQGKVQLRSLTDLTAQPVVMVPGDVATLSMKGQLTLRHQQPLSTHQAWKHHRFMFENTPVSEIAYQISEQFGVNVVVSDSALGRRTLGGTFQAKTASDVLHVIADILNAQITRTSQPDQSVETFVLTPIH
ncbi:FecR family protein [Spirosoma validum]|uniref:FecR domain-containing protein n=1 Tax=Spirosoma validum TaxID=2771355 RepID=A0A927B0B9_9BACT|nr:FecR domain-containing protein [Spirosoma validum]MBD2753044.1 FecR domain-containing protein [Spirosoma validum]